jgi:hypothetical protein
MSENMIVSDRYYTESSICSVSDEEKGRRALTTCVSYMGKGRCMLDTSVSHSNQRETCYIGVRLPFT